MPVQIKGVPLFLEAVRKALPANPKLRVVLVGGSEEDAQTVRSVGNESGCRDRLVHLARISPDDVPDFLIACDVLVSPRLEGSNTP